MHSTGAKSSERIHRRHSVRSVGGAPHAVAAALCLRPRTHASAAAFGERCKQCGSRLMCGEWPRCQKAGRKEEGMLGCWRRPGWPSCCRGAIDFVGSGRLGRKRPAPGLRAGSRLLPVL